MTKYGARSVSPSTANYARSFSCEFTDGTRPVRGRKKSHFSVPRHGAPFRHISRWSWQAIPRSFSRLAIASSTFADKRTVLWAVATRRSTDTDPWTMLTNQCEPELFPFTMNWIVLFLLDSAAALARA